MSSATSLSLPSGHQAYGVTTLDYNGDGKLDLAVAVHNTNVVEGTGVFTSLDLFTGGSGGTFSYTSTYQTVGEADFTTLGLVAGDFNGTDAGLEVAVPITDGGGGFSYLDVVPISSSGTWGNGLNLPIGSYTLLNNVTQPGNIVAADFNGAGKPSIALTEYTSGQIIVLLADPDSNQLLPPEVVPVSTAAPIGMLAAAPFMGKAAVAGYRGPTSDPSTLVQNSGGSWTRSYPDGTVLQFNSGGQETSESDRNGNTFQYAYVLSGAAAGAPLSIKDPVGLRTTLAYRAAGTLASIKDPAGGITTITVDSNGNLTKIVDPDGAVTSYGYATPSNHEITTEADPNGSTATAHYSSFGQLTSETLLDGTSSTGVSSAESHGLLAPGTSGSLWTTHQGTVTDPDGRTTTVTFNWMGHPTVEADATGATTTITYSRQGFPATVTDAMQRTASFTYDSNGNVTSITEPWVRPPGNPNSGGTALETLAYNDPYGVPTSINDFNSNTTTFSLDSHGNVLEEFQPGGVHEEWTYNSAGEVLTATDGNGNTTTFTYNSLGQLTTVSEPGPGSPTVHYGYDAAGDVTSVTDEMGDTITFSYDPMGRLKSAQDPVQAAAGKMVSYVYDHDGNLLSVTDALGHVTSYSYNARDELTGMTDAANQGTGRQTTFAYDPSGNVTSSTDPLGRTTTYSYDQDNRLTGMTDPAGDRTTYVYDLDGELTSEADPNAQTTQFNYDALGRVHTEVLPAVHSGGSGGGPGALATYTYGYDLDGDLLTAKDPNNNTTTYVFNGLNEETQAVNADGDTSNFSYDGDGNLLTASDGLGHTTSYGYDAMDRLISETQPSGGGTTTYGYDLAGRLTSLQDPKNNTTTWTYTQANEVATQQSPTGGLTMYSYDLMGNETSVVDPDGHTISYSYDADNRELTETWMNPSGGSALNVITYVYDADGELTKVSDNNATYSYGYNPAGEETSQVDSGTAGLPTVTLTYSYDPDANRTSMSDSLGGVVSYTYDARDRLTSMTLSGSGISAEGVTFGYDAAGNMTGLTRYSNLAETAVVASTTYAYDPAEQLTGITDKSSGGTTLVSHGYTYDSGGRVSQEVRVWNSGSSVDTLTYSYTNNDQLTGVSHSNSSFSNESFTYDANGNETGTGFTTTTGNEQTASPGYSYTFDANGNMITATQTSTGDKWTYSYDFRNRLTSAVEKSSGGTTLEQVTFTYDALDNRIGMDENGTQTWTLYDGSAPVMDFSGSGSLAMRYLNGPAGDLVDTVLSRQSSGGTVAWYLPDRLGTIRDLINNSGSIIDHVDYSAFGTVLGETAPSQGDRIMGFAGMERDTVTGLNLAVERAQNPGTGRWDSQDPSGFAGEDVNLYRYVLNRVTGAADAVGLSDEQVCGMTPAHDRPRRSQRRGANVPARPTSPTAPIVVAGTAGWKIIKALAKKYGLDPYELSDYLHADKRMAGRGGRANLSYKQIEELAKELASHLGKLPRGGAPAPSIPFIIINKWQIPPWLWCRLTGEMPSA
jgi:RHS repeat-associated protein